MPAATKPSPSPCRPAATPATCVLAGESFECLLPPLLEFKAPADREIWYLNTLSNQFPELNTPRSLGTAPASHVAPLHCPKNDPTLLLSSLPKRLRFRATCEPYSLTASDQIVGELLYRNWCNLLGYDPAACEPFDPELFADCIYENDYAQLTNKSRNVIIANQHRSDPDWRHTFVRIFAKSQHKINSNSIFTDWKACQTLALMHDLIILWLGPVKRYQRCFDYRSRPDHIYVHAQHSPAKLSQYCARRLTTSSSLTNDYSAFDQSQHGEAVVLEQLKMQRLSIPSELIKFHVELKCSIITQFGPLTCMRLTGEPGTYDDNTDYNLAILSSQYQLTPEHTIFVSGDDSAIMPPPDRNSAWERLEPLLAIRSKTELTDRPLFCGYYLGPAGAVRDPRALAFKLAVAIDDDSHLRKLPSYLAEFIVGHSLGDAVLSLLPAPDIPYQSACFDYFCRFATPRQKIPLHASNWDEEHLIDLLTNTKHLTRAAASLLLQLLPDDSPRRLAVLHTLRASGSNFF